VSPGLVWLAVLAGAGLTVLPVNHVTADEDPLSRLGPAGSPCDEPDFLTIACGTVRITVEGRAVANIGNDMKPVRGLSVLLDLYGRRTEVRAHSRRSGAFRFTADLPYSIQTSCVEGIVRMSETWLGRVFIFRAPGCDDTMVDVTNEWKPRDVVMRCVSLGEHAG